MSGIGFPDFGSVVRGEGPLGEDLEGVGMHDLRKEPAASLKRRNSPPLSPKPKKP